MSHQADQVSFESSDKNFEFLMKVFAFFLTEKSAVRREMIKMVNQIMNFCRDVNAVGSECVNQVVDLHSIVVTAVITKKIHPQIAQTPFFVLAQLRSEFSFGLLL